MEIGFIYKKSDPRQARAREHLRRFVRERGILARIVEKEANALSPTLIIDGKAIKDSRRRPRLSRSGDTAIYPTPAVIADALDAYIWSV